MGGDGWGGAIRSENRRPRSYKRTEAVEQDNGRDQGCRRVGTWRVSTVAHATRVSSLSSCLPTPTEQAFHACTATHDHDPRTRRARLPAHPGRDAAPTRRLGG